jgi:hypothetical protein
MGLRAAVVFLGTLGLALALPAVVHAAGPESLPSRSLVGSAPLVAADSPAQQLAALAQWTREYHDWEAWFLQWRSRPEPGMFSSKSRRTPPVPPAWLGEACATHLQDTGPLAEACAAWRDWSSGDEGAGLVQQQMAQARSAHEAPQHSVWWEHVHVDALWPMTQTGSQAFGLAGMHTTVSVTKRFEVFLTPGAILMRVPAINGGMTWSAATDWGFSYRLMDFHMPMMQRASTLHFNIVRVWMLGGQALQTPGELYLAGFSITFKRR